MDSDGDHIEKITIILNKRNFKSQSIEERYKILNYTFKKFRNTIMDMLEIEDYEMKELVHKNKIKIRKNLTKYTHGNQKNHETIKNIKQNHDVIVEDIRVQLEQQNI